MCFHLSEPHRSHAAWDQKQNFFFYQEKNPPLTLGFLLLLMSYSGFKLQPIKSSSIKLVTWHKLSPVERSRTHSYSPTEWTPNGFCMWEVDHPRGRPPTHHSARTTQKKIDLGMDYSKWPHFNNLKYVFPHSPTPGNGKCQHSSQWSSGLVERLGTEGFRSE